MRKDLNKQIPITKKRGGGLDLGVWAWRSSDWICEAQVKEITAVS
jgi:hypothetical protein